MVAELVGPPPGGLAEPPKVAEKPRRPRVPVLDGIRGWIAVGVAFAHTAYFAGVMDVGPLKGVPVLNWLTVGLTIILTPFFLLSGMLLYKGFAKATFTGGSAPNVKTFLVRRLLRIVPMYWVMIVACLLLLNLSAIDGLWYVISPLLGLHYFKNTDYTGLIPGLEITWSVVTELMFYLLLPIAAALINRYARKVAGDPKRQLRRMLWSMAPFVLLGPAWEIYTHLPSMGLYPIEIFWPPMFLGVMAIGMMLGALNAYQDVTGEVPWLYRAAGRSPLSWWVAAFGLYILNCVRPFDKAGSGDYPPMSQALLDHVSTVIWGVLVLVPLVSPVARSRLMDAVLGNRVSVFLGRISYGIYLWHFPMVYLWLGAGSVFGTAAMAMPGMANGWLLAQVLASSIVMATVSFYVVERPLGRLGGRLFRTGTPTAAL
ncbi:acyltransferase family protein [Actinophytocola xinjiangensis]|uniref:acyltransferase family protein n=1 Tax=Actinophytocola xinjiangensis TaxID=485602 RepID=UPI000A02980A|nr:acyltransferase [Actinophytocola xinjiangensis]